MDARHVRIVREPEVARPASGTYTNIGENADAAAERGGGAKAGETSWLRLAEWAHEGHRGGARSQAWRSSSWSSRSAPLPLVLRGSGTAVGTRECNGAALCDFRLDEVSLATTHNAMNHAEDPFRYPNQERGIEAQLEDGVRGFLIDAYLGSVRTAGSEQIVYIHLSDKRLTKMGKAARSEPAQQALGLRELAVHLRPTRLTTCTCATSSVSWARSSFRTWVEVLHRFLDENRGEAVVVVIQDDAWRPKGVLLPVIEEGGLDLYLATVDPSLPLPVLGSMVESGRRLRWASSTVTWVRPSPTCTTPA